MADKWFDYSTYMANKRAQLNAADPSANWTAEQVADAFEQAGFKGVDGAQQHFEQYGHTAEENLSPNANFIQSQYYIFKAADYFDVDVAKVTEEQAAYIQAAIKDAGMSAWDHYTQYGTKEGINPSNNFDTQKYLEAKLEALKAEDSEKYGDWTTEDVAEAFAEAGMNALEHAMQYSGEENEAPAAFNADGTPTDAYKVDTKIVVDGVTLALTEGVDNVSPTSTTLQTTAGDDTINGVVDNGGGTTLQLADIIDGGDGEDTLNVTLTTAGDAIPGATISNVEILKVRNLGDDSVPSDLSTITGLTEIDSVSSSGVAAFTNVQNAVTLGLEGTTNNSGMTVAYAANKLASSTATQVVKVNGVGATGNGNAAVLDLDVDGTDLITKMEITSSEKASVLQVKSHAAAGADVNLTDLVISGDAKLTLTADNGAIGANLKSVDASGMTDGGVVIDLSDSASVNFNGSAGKDIVTTDANNLATQTLAGGDGSDTLALAAADFTGTLTAASFAKVSGFEVFKIDTTNAADATLDASVLNGFTGIQVGALAANDAQITNLSSGVRVDALGNQKALTLNLGATELAKDTPSLTLGLGDADAKTAATVTALDVTGVKALTVDSLGAANTINAITDPNLVSITVTGDKGLTLSSLATNTKLESIDGSGLSVGTTANGLTIETGALTLDTTEKTLTITGSSGIDAITVTDDVAVKGQTFIFNASAGADTYTLEATAGNNATSRIVYTDASQSTASATDTITNFVATTDVIDISALTNAFTWQGDAAFTKTGSAQGRYSDNNTVQIDLDGDATADMVITVTGAADQLTALNFDYGA